MLINCPFCKRPVKTKLIADFYFCDMCEIAVRNERDMPQLGIKIYDKDWVRSQENDKAIFVRASYALKQVRKLYGIRTVLDVGCGTGFLVDTLNRNGYIAEGIDTSAEAIEFAKTNERGNFYCSSIESFKNEHQYDLIIATQLIEHLRRPEEFLINVIKLLKTGGYLYIETPNLRSWSESSIWRRRIGGLFYGTDHRICYTAKSLTHLLRNNGFNVYKINTKTFSPTIFVEFLKTLISVFAKKEKQVQKESSFANSTSTKNVFINIFQAATKQIRDSLIADILLFIPNKISEINNRGNQLIVMAKNNSDISKIEINSKNLDSIKQEVFLDMKELVEKINWTEFSTFNRGFLHYQKDPYSMFLLAEIPAWNKVIDFYAFQRGSNCKIILDIGTFIPYYPTVLKRLGYQIEVVEKVDLYGCAYDPILKYLNSQDIKVHNLDIIKDPIATLPVGVDVLLIAILEHLNGSPRLLMNKIKSLMDSNSLLYIHVPNICKISNVISTIRGKSLLPPYEDYYYSEYPFSGHNREMTLKELQLLCNYSSLEIVEEGYSIKTNNLSIKRKILNVIKRIIPKYSDSVYVIAKKVSTNVVQNGLNEINCHGTQKENLGGNEEDN